MVIKSTGKDGVTIYQPPNSVHFDPSACLKTKDAKPEDAPDMEPSATTANAARGPNFLPQQLPQHPQQPAYLPHYSPPPPPPWMYSHYSMPGPHAPVMSYLYPTLANYSGPPYGQQPGPFSWPPKDSPASSPATALQIGVPLAEFCARYKISESDREKLALLEYKPGNNAVTTLTPEDWKEVKFSALGWKAFISAHKQFIHDVKDGSWLRV